MATMNKGEIRYGEKIDGDAWNHGWRVRFDDTDGYIGIDQYDRDVLTDRVLLSPNQVRALLKFLGAKRSTGRARQDTDNA